MNSFVVCVLLTAFAPIAAAQQKGLPDPASAAAPVPSMVYESPFASYAPYRNPEVASWRDANDEVARAGGHAGIFRAHGGHVPAKAVAVPAAPGAAPKATPHAGHGPASK